MKFGLRLPSFALGHVTDSFLGIHYPRRGPRSASVGPGPPSVTPRWWQKFGRSWRSVPSMAKGIARCGRAWPIAAMPSAANGCARAHDREARPDGVVSAL
jgi:hypothetical protein